MTDTEITSTSAGDRALTTAAQLQSIGFVEFSTHLIADVYRTIVESSMDQLKAYADFVNIVAKTLAEYEADVIGPDADATADNYIENVLLLTISDPAVPDSPISLSSDQAEALKQHFAGITQPDPQTPNTQQPIGFFITENIIKLGILRGFVIEKLKSNVRDSYNLLKTILKIGMQKVVVTNGDILTKLTFHVDATDTYSKTTEDIRTKSTSWGIQGSVTGQYSSLTKKLSLNRTKTGGELAATTSGMLIGASVSGSYSSSKISVSVVNEQHTAATNVTLDIIGQVRIQFKTETFPTVES